MGTLFNRACSGGVKLHVMIFVGDSPVLRDSTFFVSII